MNVIDRFSDEYFFLSNFYPCKIEYDNLTYDSSEALFQALKCINIADRKLFVGLTASDAKKLGRKVNLRPDWEDIKINVMRLIVHEKFAQNPYLKMQLYCTNNAILVEGNTWFDTFWGECNGVGENNLGKILMEERTAIAHEIEMNDLYEMFTDKSND